MKRKIIILLLLVVGCTNKDYIKKYGDLRRHYEILMVYTNFVIDNQSGIISDRIVTIFDKDTIEFRQATLTDNIKAWEVKSSMESLKNSIGSVIKYYKDIEDLYPSKNIFNKKKKQKEINLFLKWIKYYDNNMLKETGGLDLKEYINLYLPVKLKITESMEPDDIKNLLDVFTLSRFNNTFYRQNHDTIGN